MGQFRFRLRSYSVSFRFSPFASGSNGRISHLIHCIFCCFIHHKSCRVACSHLAIEIADRIGRFRFRFLPLAHDRDISILFNGNCFISGTDRQIELFAAFDFRIEARICLLSEKRKSNPLNGLQLLAVGLTLISIHSFPVSVLESKVTC